MNEFTGRRLPTCPRWCQASHGRPGKPHWLAIETIPAKPGHIEVEIDLMKDQGNSRPFVLVRTTDTSADRVKDSLTEIRLSLEQASLVGWLMAELDPRGSNEVGLSIGEAVQTVAEVEGWGPDHVEEQP